MVRWLTLAATARRDRASAGDANGGGAGGNQNGGGNGGGQKSSGGFESNPFSPGPGGDRPSLGVGFKQKRQKHQRLHPVRRGAPPTVARWRPRQSPEAHAAVRVSHGGAAGPVGGHPPKRVRARARLRQSRRRSFQRLERRARQPQSGPDRPAHQQRRRHLLQQVHQPAQPVAAAAHGATKRRPRIAARQRSSPTASAGSAPSRSSRFTI